MKCSYPTEICCARQIEFDVDESGVVSNIVFFGGCDGNTKGITKLVDGMKADDVIEKLEGTQCGFRGKIHTEHEFPRRGVAATKSFRRNEAGEPNCGTPENATHLALIKNPRKRMSSCGLMLHRFCRPESAVFRSNLAPINYTLLCFLNSLGVMPFMPLNTRVK